MHEILLSGSVGSAKSILLAHAAIKHCLRYTRARVLVGRRSTTDLRLTIWKKILDHLEGSMTEGVDYFVNLTRLEITFSNRSEIICRSWADGQYLKLRSLELSAAIIDEIVENSDDEKQAYDEIRMRVGRLPHIHENWILSATNPGAPDSWVYKHLVLPNLGADSHPTRHVYYSVTTDNPYLPPQYIAQLKADLDPRMARRMIYGEWLEIAGDVIYYAYSQENRIREKYTPNPRYPITLTWDFNIGEDKPMSAVALQYIDDTFHIFSEAIIDGGRTADTLEDFDHKGILSKNFKYKVCGDASGKHRDTRQGRSDYDIIISELSKRGLDFDFCVLPSNPSIRNRHNKVNAYCLNSDGRRRIRVYDGAETVDEALRLTKLKSTTGYIEDDSKRFQHCGTAVGYALFYEILIKERKPQGTIIL